MSMSRLFGSSGSRTPMHEAAAIGDVEAIDNLMRNLVGSLSDETEIEKQVNTLVNAKTEGGNTPLMLAARNNKIGAVNLLLKLGANPNLQNNRFETAYFMADNSEIKKILGGITRRTSGEGSTAPSSWGKVYTP